MKLIIFDFDGTLLNTLDQMINDMNKSLKIHNFPKIKYDEIKYNVAGNINQVISRILGENSSEENIQKVKNTYLKIIYQTEDTYSKPYKGINNVLTKLQEENILLAINSNRYNESINLYVKKFFKNINFIDIQGHNPPNPPKPNPFGVFNIIDKTHVNKEDVIYVGDSQTDIDTAMNAGIKCIYVTWGYSKKYLIKGDIMKTIDTPEELLTIIKET